jgi:hypothetical protein
VGALDAKQTKRKAKLEKGQTTVEEGRKELVAELRALVDSFRVLSIPEDRIESALVDGKVPSYMRKALKD